MNNIKVIVIPDVHGRTFWKNALEKYPQANFPDLRIIFLGDYLDPYSNIDGIDSKMAYDNFLEIIEYAKQDSRIQLLIGNHDWHYFVNLDTCRIDKSRSKVIKQLFIDNMHLFKLLDIVDINEHKYLFSHAGFTKAFLNDISNMAKSEINNWKTNKIYPNPNEDPKYLWLKDLSNICETYNFDLFDECLKNYNDTFYSCIPSIVSRERGGWHPHGSMIWADVYEHLVSLDSLPDEYYQIFGHTISFPLGKIEEFFIDKKWAMLDASKAFTIDAEGNINPII